MNLKLQVARGFVIGVIAAVVCLVIALVIFLNYLYWHDFGRGALIHLWLLLGAVVVVGWIFVGAVVYVDEFHK